MWSPVLVLALLAALNPVRLGLALLVISRPRPVQNLLAYWIGCVLVSVAYLLVPLMLLHFTPMFKSFSRDLASPATAASSTVRHIQIGMGVFALSLATLLAVRFVARQRAHQSIPRNNAGTVALDSNPPTAISSLLAHARDAATQGGSPSRRLLGRAYSAWENGSWWVALLFGLGSGPSPDAVLYVLAFIVPSGAAIGTQAGAAVVFVIGMLVVVEAMLACYLVTPAKTEAAVRLVRNWAGVHYRKVVVAVFAVAGVALIAQGTGSI